MIQCIIFSESVDQATDRRCRSQDVVDVFLYLPHTDGPPKTVGSTIKVFPTVFCLGIFIRDLKATVPAKGGKKQSVGGFLRRA